MVKGLLTEPEKYLLSILEKEGFVTSWHQNDEFLVFVMSLQAAT